MPRFFRCGAASLVVCTLGLPASSSAQGALTLAEAMSRARTDTPQARALNAAAAEASHRIGQARAGYFPVIDVTESVERGNHPVFVFGALLGQRRFAEANFAIPALNEPDPVTNIRTYVRLEQPVFDAGATRHAVRGAQLQRDAVDASRAGSMQDLAVAAAQAFVRVLQLEAAQRASDAAVKTAESDLARASSRREVGVTTSADVLAVQVHLASMRQRHISAGAELAIARLELGEAIGAPAGEVLSLARPAPPSEAPRIDALITAATASRPELQAAVLRTQIARSATAAARAAYLPRVSVQGGFELNGATVAGQRSSWIAGAQLHWNVFRGFADTARIAERAQAELRAAAERERVERRIATEVRSLVARLEAARARHAAGEASLAQARESHRIIRDRYDSGLATITDVLRAAEAMLEAESLAITAEMDLVLHAVALDRAVGRL